MAMIRLAYYLTGSIFTSALVASFLLAFPLPAQAGMFDFLSPEPSKAAAPAAPPKILPVGFQDGKGNTVFLHDFKGKPVILNLWAKWCGPCMQEMPSLGQLQKEYKAQGLTVLALSEDETLADMLAFYKKNPAIPLYPFWDKQHVIFIALQARGLPTTLLVDKYGKEVKRIEGPVNWQGASSRKMIDELIAIK